MREDLVDFADVLPTLTDVAQAAVPDTLKIDGTSLMPLFEGKPRTKEYIYCWYQRNGVRNKAKQLVRTQRYKLYASGRFFDIQKDPLEQSPIEPGMAEGTHSMLRSALSRHLQATSDADPIIRAKRAKKTPK